MQLCTAERSLVFLPLFLALGWALPFKAEDNAHADQLQRRATYSVVAVDGGSAPTSSESQVPTTIFQTITKPAVPITTTVVEVDVSTLPGTTDVIVSVQTIKDTTTVTSYSIVDVKIPPVTVTKVSVVSAVPSTSTTSSIVLPSTTATTSPTTPSSSFSSTTPVISTSYTSTLTSSTSQTTSISTAPVSTFSTTTQSFDNGQWHTSYTHWSNTTATFTSPGATSQAASTFRSMPTTLAGDAAVNSIPIDNSAQAASPLSKKRDLGCLIKEAITNAFRLSQKQS
ncbi:hypothetical protein B7463_g4160, partial [Scytalidium lignicola]